MGKILNSLKATMAGTVVLTALSSFFSESAQAIAIGGTFVPNFPEFRFDLETSIADTDGLNNNTGLFESAITEFRLVFGDDVIGDNVIAQELLDLSATVIDSSNSDYSTISNNLISNNSGDFDIQNNVDIIQYSIEYENYINSSGSIQATGNTEVFDFFIPTEFLYNSNSIAQTFAPGINSFTDNLSGLEQLVNVKADNVFSGNNTVSFAPTTSAGGGIAGDLEIQETIPESNTIISLLILGIFGILRMSLNFEKRKKLLCSNIQLQNDKKIQK